jgi:hypothetical protein
MDVAFAHCYSLHGLNLLVQCEEKALADESEQLLAFLPFEKSDRFNSHFHFTLKFVLSEKTAHIQRGRLKPYIVNDISIFETNSLVLITDGDSTFNIEPWSVRGTVSIHPSFTKKALTSKSNFFLLGLTYLFSYQGLFDLHGAALANDGVGYLLLGEANSGKSSIALNLVHQGWHYASDDSLLLRSNGEAVEVLSFRKIFYIDPAVASKYPELDTLVSKKSNASGSKSFLDLEKAYPNQFQPSIVPRVLIFSKIMPDQKSSIQLYCKGQALADLLKQSISIFFNRQAVTQHTKILSNLVNQCGCYQLLAGRGLYDEPEKILKILPRNY